MYKVNIYPFEIGKSYMGAETHSTENDIRKRPLILYGAPVWKGVLDITCYKAKLIRVQRLINIRIAKAYRSVKRSTMCNNGLNTY